MYTEECAHSQSNTEFFYSSDKSFLYPGVSVKFLFEATTSLSFLFFSILDFLQMCK